MKIEKRIFFFSHVCSVMNWAFIFILPSWIQLNTDDKEIQFFFSSNFWWREKRFVLPEQRNRNIFILLIVAILMIELWQTMDIRTFIYTNFNPATRATWNFFSNWIPMKSRKQESHVIVWLTICHRFSHWKTNYYS